MSNHTRRQFLEDSMLTTAAALSVAAAPAAATDKSSVKPVAPNEKLGVAVLGIHGQGTVHCSSFVNNPTTEILYICDPDQQLGKAQA